MGSMQGLAHRPRAAKILTVAAFMVMAFSVVWTIPGLAFTREAMIAAMGLALPWLVARKLLSRRERFADYEIYALVILVIVPVAGAAAAAATFGQPVLYGLLAQRGLLMVGAVLMLAMLIDRGRAVAEELEAALKLLAWVNLVGCTLVLILLDPNNYSDMPTFVTDGGGVYNKFKLPNEFISFGLFYYAVSGSLRRNGRRALLAVPFAAYLVLGIGGRSAMVAAFAAYCIAIFSWAPGARKFSLFLKAGLSAAVFMTVFHLAAPEEFSVLRQKFSDAFNVTFAGAEVDDPSADSRRLQAAMALPYIVENPILGSGVVSNQWNDGYKGLFGYFHPTDIGLLGVLFVYGALGVVLFAYQFVMAWRRIRKRRMVGTDRIDLFYAVATNVIFIGLYSVTSGAFAFGFIGHCSGFVSCRLASVGTDSFSLRACLARLALVRLGGG